MRHEIDTLDTILNFPKSAEEFNIQLETYLNTLSISSNEKIRQSVLNYCALKCFKLSNKNKYIFREGKKHKMNSVNQTQVKPNDLNIAKKYMAKANEAKKRGVFFNLTFFDMKKLLSRKTCAYTKAKFTEDNNLSIDRINNSLGYEVGNVIAVSHNANQYKENVWESNNIKLTKKERLLVMKAILEQNGYIVSEAK